MAEKGVVIMLFFILAMMFCLLLMFYGIAQILKKSAEVCLKLRKTLSNLMAKMIVDEQVLISGVQIFSDFTMIKFRHPFAIMGRIIDQSFLHVKTKIKVF